MKIYIYSGLKKDYCFKDFQKACDFAIKDTIERFPILDLSFVGHTRWLKEGEEDIKCFRKFKIYFTEKKNQTEPICAYIKEYKTED